MGERPDRPLIINGWTIIAHPLFLDQIEAAIDKVEKARKKHPKDYRRKNSAKYLIAVKKAAFTVLPCDPTRPEYRQGKTLGDDYKHWFRVKFLQQYRLFFRYSTESKTIALAWVNDDKNLRAYGSKADAYATYRNMLDQGNPPDNWEELLAEAQAASPRLSKMRTVLNLFNPLA